MFTYWQIKETQIKVALVDHGQWLGEESLPLLLANYRGSSKI
jgi:hypothetical protein